MAIPLTIINLLTCKLDLILDLDLDLKTMRTTTVTNLVIYIFTYLAYITSFFVTFLFTTPSATAAILFTLGKIPKAPYHLAIMRIQTQHP